MENELINNDLGLKEIIAYIYSIKNADNFMYNCI